MTTFKSNSNLSGEEQEGSITVETIKQLISDNTFSLPIDSQGTLDVGKKGQALISDGKGGLMWESFATYEDGTVIAKCKCNYSVQNQGSKSDDSTGTLKCTSSGNTVYVRGKVNSISTFSSGTMVDFRIPLDQLNFSSVDGIVFGTLIAPPVDDYANEANISLDNFTIVDNEIRWVCNVGYNYNHARSLRINAILRGVLK